MSFNRRLMTLLLILVYQVLHLISTFWLFTTVISGSERRSKKLHLAYDQLGSATLGWDEDETMSSHLGRTGKPLWMKRIADWLFFHLDGQVDHCVNKIESRYK